MATRTDLRRLGRPAAVLVAVFLGLGALGTAAGTALGAVGAASAAPFGGHRHDGRGDDGRGWDGRGWDGPRYGAPGYDGAWRVGPAPGVRPGA